MRNAPLRSPGGRAGFITRETFANLLPPKACREYIGPTTLMATATLIEAALFDDIVYFDSVEFRGIPPGTKESINVVEYIASTPLLETLSYEGIVAGVDFEKHFKPQFSAAKYDRGTRETFADHIDAVYGGRYVVYLNAWAEGGDDEHIKNYTALHTATNEAFTKLEFTPGQFADRWSGCNPDITPESFAEWPLLESTSIDFLWAMNGRAWEIQGVLKAGIIADLHVHSSPFEIPHQLAFGQQVNDATAKILAYLDAKAKRSDVELGPGVLDQLPIDVPVVVPIALLRCNGDIEALGDVICSLRQELAPVRKLGVELNQMYKDGAPYSDVLKVHAAINAAWNSAIGVARGERAVTYGAWAFLHMVAAAISPTFALNRVIGKMLDAIPRRMGAVAQETATRAVHAYVNTLDTITTDADIKSLLAKSFKTVASDDTWAAMARLADFNDKLSRHRRAGMPPLADLPDIR